MHFFSPVRQTMEFGNTFEGWVVCILMPGDLHGYK